MIGTALGASPATRPFYNHGGLVPITRYVLHSSMTQAPFTNTITVPGLSLGGSDTLLVGFSYDQVLAGAFPTVTFNAVVPGQYATQTYGAAMDDQVEAWALGMNGVPVVGGTLVVDFVPSGLTPAQVGLVVIGVTGLLQPAAYDQGATAFGNSAAPDSGLTPITTKPREFVWGLIAEAGLAADALGVWQNGFTAGLRVSTVLLGLDLKEGYNVVAAVAQYRAQITGATSRRWGAICVTFREP